MAVVALAAIGLAITAGATAYSFATAPGAPQNPDLVGASRAQVEAEAQTLALRRAMEAAARQGGTAVKQGYTQTTKSDVDRAAIQTQITALQSQLNQGIYGNTQFAAQRTALEGQLSGLQQQLAAIPAGGGTVYVNASGQIVPASEAVQDFSGFGEADVQGRVARDTAQNILDLNAKYGPQFIEEALKQEALADPEGTAARKKLYELVMQQATEHPDRPVADLLDDQVGEQLTAGKNLGRMSNEMLDAAVREGAGARGGGPGGTDFSEPLTTGFAGQQRLTAAQQKALGWLTSGATPEDVDYRRKQQTLANLSDFTNNRTPQSQFQSLSGAQQGPAPFSPGPAGAQANPNAAAVGNDAALRTSAIQNNFNANQANPWMAGLSALLSGLGAAGKAGALGGRG